MLSRRIPRSLSRSAAPALAVLLVLLLAADLLRPPSGLSSGAAAPMPSPAVGAAASGDRLVVLAYHEIAEPGEALTPDLAVSPRHLEEQIAWLQEQGHHFVSVDQLLAAAAGRRPLPARPVLLSFDDGYRSVFTQAFPLLRRYHAPAVVAVVGSWLEPSAGLVEFGDRRIPRERLLSWEELRILRSSGLVEIANHSYDLHRGIDGTPWKDSQPAATTRRYAARGGYESEAAYRRRISDDLRRNNELLQRKLGVRPRVMVWPYGRYNATAMGVAASLGMPVGLNLDDGANGPAVPLGGLRRILMENELGGGAGLARELALRRADAGDTTRAAKVMHVDLDNIYDPDPAQIGRNLELLLERIRAMGVNTVYLQAFADPDGNGAADSLYFPNHQLPVRADLFAHVAWTIRTRTPVRRLYAWMPVLAFQFPAGTVPATERLVTQPGGHGHATMGYPRVSPFAPGAMARVRQIYADLSRYASFDGLLFHDDVTLNDYEDAGALAQQVYRDWGLPPDPAAIRADDRLLGLWTNRKTEYLDRLTLDLAAVVRANQPQLRTARNLYAQVVLNPHAEAWTSQSLDAALRDYDFTAVMAMPYMEQANDPGAFLQNLVREVADRPRGLEKVLFELQSTDWRQRRDLPSEELAGEIAELYRLGARHVGYYPDNLHRGTPDPARIRPVLETRSSAPVLSR